MSKETTTISVAELKRMKAVIKSLQNHIRIRVDDNYKEINRLSILEHKYNSLRSKIEESTNIFGYSIIKRKDFV